MVSWFILTGEYPPEWGGVADYTRQVAVGLAGTGDVVRVRTPPHSFHLPDDTGVEVRQLPDHFGPRSLTQLDRELDHLGPGARVLIQYVPHAFGYKAMNLPLCLWLYGRHRRTDLRVMFHEVAYPLRCGQPLRHQFLGSVNRVMASLLLRAARTVYVSTPAWIPLLRSVALPRPPIRCLPVPSNLPTTADSERIVAVRDRFGPGVRMLGHFGTYGSHVAPLLRDLMMSLLPAKPNRHVLLLGRGNLAFAKSLLTDSPHWTGRVHAVNASSPEDLVAHLSACDLLLQPYPDGVTTRRTSVMSGLALGVPILTTSGELTEPFWSGCAAVALVDVRELPSRAASVVESLLDDEAGRKCLGERGRTLYRERFSVEHTLSALLGTT